MNAHTPGPWHGGSFREDGDSPGIDISAADGANVAAVLFDSRDMEAPECLANARLIAAAPELLASAKLALNSIEGDCTGQHYQARLWLEEVIERAEGNP